MPDVDAAATLEALASEDPARRNAALVELEAGMRALDASLVSRMIELLADPSKQVRRRAAGTLARAADVDGFERSIRSALEDSDPQRRWGAAFALARAGRGDGAVFRAVLDALTAVDGDVRWSAAEIAIAYARANPCEIDAIRALACGAKPEARKMGLYCLRDLNPGATEIFVAALEDDSAGVRLAALAGLGRTLEPGPTVLARVIACLRTDADDGVRRAAAATLGRIMGDDANALAALRQAAADAQDKDLARAASSVLRRSAR
jgi:HEAT repeat protein